MKFTGKPFSCCILLASVVSSFGQSVTIQPTNQMVLNGGSAAFNATVTGGAGPFTYQWQFNGTNLSNDIIQTVAGGGGAGDGGPATNALLARPFDVASDAFGDLFIADFFGNRVRKVVPTGLITTFAGTGNGGYYGDG